MRLFKIVQMKSINVSAALLLSLISGQLKAQFQGEVYKPDTSAKVFAYSTEKTIGFSGGFNTPQFAMGDLNNDGEQDIVVYEKSAQHVRTFINYGTSGSPNYRYRPEYERNFPLISGYLKLEDYNCDNIPDLIHRGSNGFSVYKGYYNAGKELSFSYYKDLWYSVLTANPQDIESTTFPPPQWKMNGSGWSKQSTGTTPSCMPQSGTGMARFNSFNLSPGSTAILVSKPFRVSYTLGMNARVSFWIYRNGASSSVGDSISVYVNTDTTLTNAVYINRVARSRMINQPDTKPADGWYQYTFNIPTHVIGNNVYLIFKGTGQGGDNIFVDNIYWISSSPFGDVNAYVEPNGDIPGVVDIDNDGDLDFLSFNISGGYINFYKNYRLEEGLPCDSIRVDLKDACWGRFYQGFDMTQTLGVTCPTIQPNPAPLKTTHTGNTLCFFDNDGDGDYDLLNGGPGYSYIQFLQNGRIDNNYPLDSIIVQDTTWRSNSHIYNKQLFPAAFSLDIDQDGKKDILISPSADGASENYSCISYYRNTGTSSPVFTFQSDSFLVKDAVDMGSGSRPMIYDYNKDGKPDLFISGDGFFQSNGSLRSKVAYYENSSVGSNISFTLKDNDFLNIDASNFRGAYPAVGDLDNDGKDDLVIGHSNGQISFYKNSAASNSVTPVWQLTELILKDANNVAIDSVQYAAPFIYDIDKDGKQDLIIGGKNGRLFYYKNVGNSNELKLQYQTNKLGGVQADPFNSFSAYGVPFIGRVDNVAKDYLVLGSFSGRMYRYSGFQNGNTTVPYALIDTAYSFFNQDFNLRHTGYRSAPAFADIDGDGKYEMIVGNTLGGLKIFRQSINVVPESITAVGGGEEESILIYPNPARNHVYITWDQSIKSRDATVSISLLSVSGQRLVVQTESSLSSSAEINTEGIATGVYLIEVVAGDQRTTARLTIVK